MSSVPLLIGVFGDEVRAEQAVRALEVWRKANRGRGVDAIAVVNRSVSGTSHWQSLGVARTGSAVLKGLLAGLVLFGLPAAGAAALAAFVAGSIGFGLAGLVGAVPSSQVGGLAMTAALGAAIIVGFLVGLIGAALGCLVGLLVAFIHRQVRGLSRGEVASTTESLGPGGWAAVARVQPQTEPLVRDELARLGATAVVEREALPAPRDSSRSDAAAEQPATDPAPDQRQPQPAAGERKTT